jgi:YcxB-like protein
MEIQYSSKDFIEARKIFLKTKLSHKIELILYGAWALLNFPILLFIPFIPSALIGSLMLIFFPNGHIFTGNKMVGIYFAGGVLLWFLFAYGPLLTIWLDLFYKIRLTRAFKTQSSLNEKFAFTFDEEGTYYKRALSSSQQKWAFYHSMLEGQNVFLLFINKKTYYVIPKRCFANEDEIASFRNLAKSKIWDLIKHATT